MPTTPMPDLTPAEAMERLLAVKACDDCRRSATGAIIAVADEECPDCALLLYQAIEGPDPREKLAEAVEAKADELETEMRKQTGFYLQYEDRGRTATRVAALREAAIIVRVSGGPR